MIRLNLREGINMPKPVKIFLILLVVLYLPSPAMGKWAIYKRTQITNEDKNTLRFDHSTGGPVRVWLILRPKETGAFDSKLPLYQVDNNKINEVASSDGIRTNKEKDYWILWHIFNGKGALNRDLFEFINGKEVTFQYYLPDGTIKETTFNLDGAKEAINEILK